jgi:hypothetical protein
MRIVQAFIVILVSGFILGMTFRPRQRPPLPPRKKTII